MRKVFERTQTFFFYRRKAEDRDHSCSKESILGRRNIKWFWGNYTTVSPNCLGLKLFSYTEVCQFISVVTVVNTSTVEIPFVFLPDL